MRMIALDEDPEMKDRTKDCYFYVPALDRCVLNPRGVCAECEDYLVDWETLEQSDPWDSRIPPQLERAIDRILEGEDATRR